MIRAEQDRNFTFREAFDVAGGEVRQARRRDDARARRGAGRPVGGRPRHARLHPRLQAPRRRHLSRQHDDRRAHADAEEPVDQHVDRQPHVRHFAGRALLPLLEGQQVPGVRPRRGTTKTLGGASPVELRRHGVRSSRARSRRTASPATPRDGKSRHRRSTATICGCCRSTARRRATSRTAPARRARSASATCGPSRSIRRRPATRRRRLAAAAAAARRGARATIDLSKPITLSAYGEWTKKAGFYELANGELKELVYEDASFSNPVKAAKADKYPLHAPDVRRVPRSARVGPGFQGREEDQRRQSAAGRVPLGPSHPVRLQEQGRPPAAGHPRASRRLQARREAADAGELLREELAEPASLQRAVVSHRHGLVADAGGERRLHHDAARRVLPHRRVAQRHARMRSKPRRAR